MALVSVKNKYQVVIPRDVREAVGVQVSDVLEARVEAGKIRLTPKAAVIARVAESIADFAAGRSFGAFASGEELVSSLHGESAKLRAKARPRRKQR